MPGHASYARRMTMLTGYVSSTRNATSFSPAKARVAARQLVLALIQTQRSRAARASSQRTLATLSLITTRRLARPIGRIQTLPGQPCL